MGIRFAKVDGDLDSNPKIRRAGRTGREVFLFVLRIEARMDIGRSVPAAYLQPWYLAEALMMSPAEAEDGVAMAVSAGLIRIHGNDVEAVDLADDGIGPTPRARRPGGSCITYAVEAVGLDAVKIGRTTDLDKRMAALRVGSSHDLRLVATRAGDHEIETHRLLDLESARMRGEWFRLDARTTEVLWSVGFESEAD